MGPRFHKRGNTGAPGEVASALHASMGPRFHERGNGLASGTRLAGGTGFNGAALSRTRKYGYTVQEVCTAIASMGPRFHKRGNRLLRLWPRRAGHQASMGPRFHKRGNGAGWTLGGLHMKRLQWGRAFTNAEIPAPRMRSPVAPRASMGPRFHKRGNSGRVAWQVPERGTLQWGRAFTNAEM